MTELIRMVSEETKIQEYQMIHSYIKENQALEEDLAHYRKIWAGRLHVVNEALQAITTMRSSFRTLKKKAASAEKDWLAFWGIYKEIRGPHPPWI
jgi:hypothetical protein